MADDNPELDRYWAGKVDTTVANLSVKIDAEISDRKNQFERDRIERKTAFDSQKQATDALAEAVRNLTNQVGPITPRITKIDKMGVTVDRHDAELAAMKPHVDHYAAGREQMKGRVQVVRGIGVFWGVVGGAVVYVLTWLLNGHPPALK